MVLPSYKLELISIVNNDSVFEIHNSKLLKKIESRLIISLHVWFFAAVISKSLTLANSLRQTFHAVNNNNLEFRELKITTSKLQKLDDHQQGIENTNQKLLKEFSNNEAKCITYQKSVEELNDQLSRNFIYLRFYVEYYGITENFGKYKKV